MNVFLVVNRATNKRFVGLTSGTLSRARHRLHSDARRYAHLGKDELLMDVARVGIQNFVFTLIEVVDPADGNARREHWVAYFGCMEPAGYNRPRAEVNRASPNDQEMISKI